MHIRTTFVRNATRCYLVRISWAENSLCLVRVIEKGNVAISMTHIEAFSRVAAPVRQDRLAWQQSARQCIPVSRQRLASESTI